MPDWLRQMWLHWRQRIQAIHDDPLAPKFLEFIDSLFTYANEVQFWDVEWSGVPWQATHGDFHVGNVLLVNGRLTGILDFEHCRYAPRLIDIAYTCCSSLIKPGEPPQVTFARVQSFLKGYHSVAPLTPKELQLFPVALLYDRLLDFRPLHRHFDHGDGSLDKFIDSDLSALRWFQEFGGEVVTCLNASLR